MMETAEQRLLREYFGNDEEKLRDARRRLALHEPLAYILGETVFFREFYFVTPQVLIPRPDTERLVERLLPLLPERGRFLDLCTGSGCIAISALANCQKPELGAVAADLSEEALALAKKNAARNGVSDRILFLQGNLFDPAFWERLQAYAPFPVICANPPYVRSAVLPTLEEECRFEPAIAFDGGEDGMRFYRQILRFGPPLLDKDGKILLEIGYDQREDIGREAEKAGFSCRVFRDYGGNDRVALLQKNSARKEVSP